MRQPTGDEPETDPTRIVAPPQSTLPAFVEHRVPRDRGCVFVRDFPGSAPAFVLLHGFPDNSHIYDELIVRLHAAGRRAVAVDFLGFGASDKPDGMRYSFAQQLDDLVAVVDALGLERIVPVGHDSGGPAAINFALRHPDRTAAVTVLNAFYDHTPDLRVPELIEFFATKRLSGLHREFLQAPQQFAWLVGVTRTKLQAGLSQEQQRRYDEVLSPVIDANFRQHPSSAEAFLQMTAQLYDQTRCNSAHLADLRRSRVPFSFIWGVADPYLHVTIAERLKNQVRSGVLNVLEAGHWPQIDAADEVARIMSQHRSFDGPWEKP